MESDASLEHFIERLKREGVEEAKRTAQSVVEEANSRAQEILKEAREEAERMRSNVESDLHKKREAFDHALSQAGRDLILGLRQDIIKLFDRMTRRKIASSLSPDVIVRMILKIADKWQGEEGAQVLEILLREEDRAQLEEVLFKAVHEELQKGVTLKPVEGIQAGFRIGSRDGHFHYDFTDQGIAAVLSEYLNPRISRYLQGLDETHPEQT